MSVKDKLQFFVDHGMSATYIASRMEVDPSTLTKWLKGSKGITHKNEEKLNLTLNKIIEEFNSIG